MDTSETSTPAAHLRVGRLDVAIAIFIAFNLAVAQPVLDLLGQNPTFFVARRSPRFDILLLAFGLTLIVPAVVVGASELLGLAHERARRWSQVAALAVLGTLFGMQILMRLGMKGSPGPLVIAIGSTMALGGLAIVYRTSWARRLIRIVSPIPLIILAFFLLGTPVSKLLGGGEGGGTEGAASEIEKPAHLAMMVFDEFPVATLMDENGGIDRELFPNFASLTDSATWFRNYSTTHDFTDKAIPEILTGRYTTRGQLPTVQDHPKNLFRLLGSTYEVRANEPLTQLCPEDVCAKQRGEAFTRRWRGLLSDIEVVYEHVTLPRDLRKNTPRIDQTWGNFRAAAAPAKRAKGPFGGKTFGSTDPREDFEAFLDAIRPTDGPHLDFVHLALPHSPWRFLPSGQSYEVPKPSIFVQTEKVWVDDAWLTTMAWQRHIIQTMYVDRQVGQLIAHLKKLGLYEDTMIVLTADHGVSFQPGKPYRHIQRATLGDIAMPPLFMKLPGQTKGEVIDRPVAAIDIVPTIADVLGIEGLWKTDGYSAFDEEHPQRTKNIIYPQGWKAITFSVDGRQKLAVVREKHRLFGTTGGVERLYDIAPPGYERLLGTRAQPSGSTGVGARVDGFGDFGRWDPRARTLRTFVVGYLDRAPPSRIIAIAVNGEIAAVTRTFELNGPRFVALLPPEAFRKGKNSVEAFVVDGARLLRVPLRG